MALKEYVVSFVSSEKTCGPIPIENSLTGILKNLAVKKDEWTAYSDKVKSDLEVPAKRHMKSVEVPTGEKSMFGLGKEIMKTEKKPTKNVVISERDYKNLVTAAR